MTSKKILLIPKIENGFVFDHIQVGCGTKVLKLLCADPSFADIPISVGLNYISRRLGRKDLIKVQTTYLPQSILKHLSLLVPGVTIKRIENYLVAEKLKVEPPEIIDNLLSCPNPGCITNHERAVNTCFYLIKREPMKFRCNHCERCFERDELERELKML